MIESSNMCNEENHFIGLPCKNWQKITDAIFTHSNCTSSKYMSYTTVFVNRNYNRFKEWVLKYINSKNRRKIILIANSIINKDISWADQFFPVYNNLIDNWETDGTELINKLSIVAKQNKLIFFVSAGPAANIIISKLTKINIQNIYIDFGSAIEFITKVMEHAVIIKEVKR